MPEYPVFGLFKEIGQVSVWLDGLYYGLRAALQETMPGFPRLYFHGANGSLRLGLFSQCADRMESSGRISVRSMGDPGEGRFSVVEAGLLPSRTFPGALEQALPGGAQIVLRESCIPPEAMPYFCFFRPSVLADEPCFLLNPDLCGEPLAVS